MKMKDNQQPSLVFKQLKEDSDYLIYEDGRLYSKKRNRFLKGKIDNVGYLTYALAIEDKLSTSGKKLSKMVYAHRLVAEYFLENPNKFTYVIHLDKNKKNNYYSNLQWVETCPNGWFGAPRKKRYFEKNLKNEKWKIIPELPNYSISSKGRVRNNQTNRILHFEDKQKYLRVTLRTGNKNKHYYIHRLVYCVFNNDYDLNGFVIDHIDNNPRNNCLENLQKITQKENCLKQERFND